MTKSIYDAFGTDTNLEQNGIEVDYGDYGTFTIARSGGANQKYTRLLEAKSRPYRRQIAAGNIDIELMNGIIQQVMARTIVLGWDNVYDRDGKKIKFTTDACIKLFKDLPDLYEFLRDESQMLANYLILELEEDAKN